jgi:hypothetical protein
MLIVFKALTSLVHLSETVVKNIRDVDGLSQEDRRGLLVGIIAIEGLIKGFLDRVDQDKWQETFEALDAPLIQFRLALTDVNRKLSVEPFSTASDVSRLNELKSLFILALKDGFPYFPALKSI